MTNAILASTSTVHGSDFLDYLLPEIEELYSVIDTVLFVPYARPNGVSYDDYSKKAAHAFNKINVSLIGIHELEDPILAIERSQGIFVGGGNTFVLVNELYRNKLISSLQTAILNGTPFLGTSAGTNICGLTLGSTNDMPIVYPPSFETLGIIPFNINPHYLDPDPDSTHMGETRETRIFEFHKYNDQPVLGLREGSYLRLKEKSIELCGPKSARLFRKNQEPRELESNSILSATNGSVV